VLLIFCVFLCCVFCFHLFVFVLCLVFPVLPVSLDCSFLIVPSVSCNIYLKNSIVSDLELQVFIFILTLFNFRPKHQFLPYFPLSFLSNFLILSLFCIIFSFFVLHLWLLPFLKLMAASFCFYQLQLYCFSKRYPFLVTKMM